MEKRDCRVLFTIRGVQILLKDMAVNDGKVFPFENNIMVKHISKTFHISNRKQDV